MQRKHWILSGSLALTAFLSLGGAELIAQGVQDFTQAGQRAKYLGQPGEKGINSHDFGIRVAVQNPLTDKQFRRRIVVRDLGPNVAGLVDDRVPGAAYVRIDGAAPQAFVPDGQGQLVYTVSPARLSPFGSSSVEVAVHDDQGRHLFSASLAGLFF